MVNAQIASDTPVTTALDGDIVTVTINRPPLNLLSRSTKAALREVFMSLRTRSEVRAVILRGAGHKAFSAGADISEFPQRISDGDAATVSREGHQLVQAIQDCGKPTLAAIDGIAFGAGLELVLAADLRIASDRAVFALPEVTRGVFPGNGGTQLLPRIIGPARALELMLLGSRIDSADAYRIGLVHQVVPNAELLPAARRCAEALASRPAAAVASIRRLVSAAVDLPLQEGLELEENLFAEVFRTEAVCEGVAAFKEKRSPNFRLADQKEP